MSVGNGRASLDAGQAVVLDGHAGAGAGPSAGPSAGSAAGQAPGSVSGGSVLPARVKTRRRPLLVAVMVGLVCLGALVSVWAYRSASDTQQVLAARDTVLRGDVIDQSDLMSVTVSVDPALDPIPDDAAASIVGKRAALDLAAGSLLTGEAVTDTVLPVAGSSIVGVTLAPGMLPAEPLYAGDTVRLVTTPGMDGDPATVVEPTTLTAIVVGTTADVQTGNTVVDVTLPVDQAAVLAARAATGKVGLVLDARER